MSPGFSQEALTALKMKTEDSKVKDKTTICNLVLDEMSIRKKVEWTGTKFAGYVDIGTNINSDVLPEAKEVLVFMLVCLNDSWKIPVGYFFLDGLAAIEKAELVKKCLEFTSETGITVSSLTFDGAPVNFTMAAKLGADFSDVRSLKTYFLHPVTGQKVFIFLDPCHMIKLVRNTFGSQKYLQDYSGNEINWTLLEQLVEKQNYEGLHLATKIKKRHLQWTREKMKVKFATQILSKSVADALLYLCIDLKVTAFKDAQPTATFIKYFNDLFDVFNSRNRKAKYFFKRPFSDATFQEMINFLNEMYSYICNLKLGNIPVVQSSRKTGFLGFLICIQSLKELYELYVRERKQLKYILTNKISQDHLELFFGAIRSKGGYNNNPTARQFESAYKRLLIHTEVTGPQSGNITNPENLLILTCSSGQKITHDDNGDDMQFSKEYLSLKKQIEQDMTQNLLADSAWNLTLFVEDVVGYISGFILKMLKKCITCQKCLEIMEGDIALSQLQKRKQYGNLMKASEVLIKICSTAERYFRFFCKSYDIFNKNIKYLMPILIRNTMKLLSSSILTHFNDHFFEDDPIDGHTFTLIKLILKHYFNLRIHHETVKKHDLSKNVRIRSVLTKTILFRNE